MTQKQTNKPNVCMYQRLLCCWKIPCILNCSKVHNVLREKCKNTIWAFKPNWSTVCVWGGAICLSTNRRRGEWHRKDILQAQKQIFFFKTLHTKKSRHGKLDYLPTNTSRLILLYVFLDNLTVSVACVNVWKTLNFGYSEMETENPFW